MMTQLQVAREIFLFSLSVMKSILSLMEFRLDKDTEAYVYAKKQIMSSFYGGIKELFIKLEKGNIIQHCECNSNLRQGYKKCDMCSGAGYRNKDLS